MENKNALDEINKGACMGKDAIDAVLDKVEDMDFKKLLKKQYKKYDNILSDIDDIYSNYDDEEPSKTSMMNKVMTKYGVDMRTMTDHSSSKIAELLIQGTNMGIIEGRRILNNKKINKEVAKILEKFVYMQEESMEELKKYL